MYPVATDKTTTTFKLVGGTEANDLPLEQAWDEDGHPLLRSTWELTPEECATLVAGGRIELQVWGVGTPPVSLAVVEA